MPWFINFLNFFEWNQTDLIKNQKNYKESSDYTITSFV